MLIESFHSGHRGHRIYCSLHRPSTRLVRASGIVLCNPLGHEYYRTHRSYVKLAAQLSQLGFPVMRFDYSGTGDSEGDRMPERLSAWLDEVSFVVDLLRESEPVSSVALGGIRFGATLSLLAAQRLTGINALMLWDPALDGEDYMNQVQHLQERMLGDLERFPRARGIADCNDGELIGTEYAPILLREINSITPAGLLGDATPDVDAVVVTSDGMRVAGIRESVRRPRIHEHRSRRNYGWQDAHRIGETIMDPEAIRHFTTSMGSIAA